ncbi:hypothetical protein OG225_42970 (plasmid) [Nocardia sp. NBC_01377]
MAHLSADDGDPRLLRHAGCRGVCFRELVRRSEVGFGDHGE